MPEIVSDNLRHGTWMDLRAALRARFRNFFLVKGAPEELTELADWCEEVFGDPGVTITAELAFTVAWLEHPENDRWACVKFQDRAAVYVKNDADAVLFRLRW